MIKSILVLKFLLGCYSVNATVNLEFPKDRGPLSFDCMKKIFEQYSGETIVITYTQEFNVLHMCKQLFRGDFRVVSQLGHWMVKKGIKLISLPPTLVYCIFLYSIYRAYRLIKPFHIMLTSHPCHNNDVIMKDIHAMLYKKINPIRRLSYSNKEVEKLIKEEKENLYMSFKSYRAVCSVLKALGIRKLLWCNKDYEESIERLLSIFEGRFDVA